MGIFRDVTWKGDAGEGRIYVIIAVFILIVVVFAVVFGSSQLTPAYIPDNFLGEGWSENIGERDSGSQFLGLEKWCSITYMIGEKYPAYLTVTTIKTLIMMNENELRDKTIETIEKALQQGIAIDNNTKVTGERVLKNRHKTMYIIYDGNDTSKDPSEKIKIIGEIWNCGASGTSIICIGVAQITDNAHNNSEINTVYWKKIVRDENGVIDDFVGDDGLIYNVICH